MSKNDMSLDTKSLWKSPKRYERLPIEEFNALIARAQNQDQEAIADLVKRNIRLVLRYAAKYPTPNLTFEDLVQEGVTGLLVAIQKFDTSRGTQFSTLAGSWVQQAIRRKAINSRLIHIPEGRMGFLLKIKSLEQFAEAKGEELTNEDLSELLNLPIRKIEKLRSVPTPRAVRVSDARELLRTRHNHVHDPLEFLALAESRGFALRSLEILADEERDMLLDNFGLGKAEAISMSKLSSKYGVSPEVAKAKICKALRKLREHLTHIGYQR